MSPAHQRSPDYIPVRTEEAQVDLLVLGLMDGITPLGKIARQAAAQYPAYFTSCERALEYVSKLSEDYARWATYERT